MANGGIIGPVVEISTESQAELITSKTSSGSFTTQPLTQSLTVLVVAGGGGSSYGAGGAGGVRIVCSPISAATPFTVTIGAGGGASANGNDSSIIRNRIKCNIKWRWLWRISKWKYRTW
jgi:hypothetical protein